MLRRVRPGQQRVDFKEWVREALQPWAPALTFVKRLRTVLKTRSGGWQQLGKDLEAGPKAYADIMQVLRKPLRKGESLTGYLAVQQPGEAPRVLATIVAQAFLHQNSQRRRTEA